MNYTPQMHHRRSIRLKEYDYSQSGAYFVTLCTQNRIPLFGNIMNAEMRMNAPGQMTDTTWNEIRDHYPGIDTDAFVVMPNHIHGIIIIVGASHAVGAHPCVCPGSGCPPGIGHPRGGAPTLSLPDVVQRFKSLTTKRYMDGVKQSGWGSFPGKLWQCNYYEHIIRDEPELFRIQKYIMDNPAKWYWDRMNLHGDTDIARESDASYAMEPWMV